MRMMRILASRAVTATELAQEFGITRRQAYRDLQQIQECEHPLEQHDGLWQLPLGYKGLPQIPVSHYELMSLYLAKSHMAHLAGTPFADDLDGLIKKIETCLPQKTINHLERIVQTFFPLLQPVRGYAKQKAVLDAIRKALLLQLSIVLRYQKPDAAVPLTYKVDPYVLVLRQNGLYVVGYTHRPKALRMFAVERIRKADLTEERFSTKPDLLRKAVSQHRFGLIDEIPQEVRIRFKKESAYLFKERQWHPTQTIKKFKNGDVVLTMQAGGLDEIATWVLSWGPQAKVLSPPALVQLVTAELTTATRQYRRPR